MNVFDVEGDQKFIVDNKAVMYHRASDVEVYIYSQAGIVTGVLAEDELGQQIVFPFDTGVLLVQ